MATTSKAVLVGCGGISRAWLSGITQMDNVELAGLVDIYREAAEARAAEFGLGDIPIDTDLAAMLDRVQPDVVFNCTIPEAHYEVTLTALKHGCHVLGEKPLADTMEHAREMVAAADEVGKTFAVMQNRRYDARIRRWQSFLASGALGDLTTLNSDFYIGAHFGGFRDRMRHVLLLDMAIHTFDAARFLSGADPVAVYCHEWNPKGSWYDHDASAAAIFEMSDGLVYTYRGSWCAEGLNTTWECEWRALGEVGSSTWDGAEGYRAQSVAKAGGFRSEWQDLEVPEIDPAGKDGGHVGLIADYVRCIQAGEAPETVAHDNIKSLAMVIGAIESAETGKRVEIRI